MADNQVLIQIRGDVADINAKLADLKGYIGKVKDETRTLGEQGKTSWQMMAAGVASVVYLFNQAVQAVQKLAVPALSVANAYGEQEQALFRLQRALVAHGVGTEAVVKAYADMASQYQSTTKYSDEQIMSAQEALTTWGVVPSQMQEALKTTMALAVRTGDLGSAAEMLGQAFDGNTRRLGRLLPGIKGLEVGSLSAGDAMKMIREQLGETSQAQAEGYLVKVKKLENAWDDFKETLGQYVVPALKSLINESINGIHALERLFGVNTLAWKQKELQLVEERIKAAQKGAPPGSGGEFAQQEDDLYALYMQRNKLKADIAAEDKKNQDALKNADDDFIKARSAQGDALAKKWAESRSKLVAETETAGMDEHTKKIGDIIAQAAKLRSEFKLIAGAERTITEWETAQIKEQNLQDRIEAGKYLDAEKERLRKNQASQYDDSRAIRLTVAEEKLNEITQKRSIFAITTEEYLQEELSIKQELIQAEYDRIAQGEQTAAQLDSSLDKIRNLRNQIFYIDENLNKSTWLGGATFALDEFADKAKNTGKLVGDYVTKTFDSMTDSLTDFVMTGKADFADFANSIIRDLVRIMIQQSITGPLASGIGGFIGSLFSQGASSSPGYAVAETGAVGYGGVAGGYHKGGMATEPSFYKVVANLPRHHRGIGPGERLSVTTDEEMILTPGQQKRFFDLAQSSAGKRAEVNNNEVHVHMTINALDSRSVSQALAQHRIEIVGMVNEAYNKIGKRGPLG